MTKEAIRMVTPTATCQWAHIVKPDTQFDPEGKFKIELIFEISNATHLTFLKQLRDIHDKNKDAMRSQKKPCEKEPWIQYTDTETQKKDKDKYVVRFKSSYHPFLADARGNKWPKDTLVGNGSKVKVAFSPNAYSTGSNSGTNLYLNGVQIIDLVPYKEASFEDLGFQQEEGFDVAAHYSDAGTESPFADKGPEDPFSQQQNQGCNDKPEYKVDEDEIPF